MSRELLRGLLRAGGLARAVFVIRGSVGETTGGFWSRASSVGWITIGDVWSLLSPPRFSGSTCHSASSVALGVACTTGAAFVAAGGLACASLLLLPRRKIARAISTKPMKTTPTASPPQRYCFRLKPPGVETLESESPG